MSDGLNIDPFEIAPVVPGRGDRVARKLLVPLSIAFFVLVMIFQVLFSTSAVRGDSMEPTLHTGDRLLVTKSYEQPQRRDVVIFRVIDSDSHEEGLIKRVVALAGDTVEIRQGIALVNGKVESLTSVKTSEQDTYRDPLVVPPGHVYVLGDNRPVALDSRDLGPIPVESIRGQVVYIFAPLTRAGALR